MKTNLIYACKNKLIGIDSVLPLLMEIKERFDDINIVILFPSEFTYLRIKKNYHIWKALEKINALSFITVRKNRVARYVTWLRVILLMVFRRNIIIKRSDILPHHKKFISIMKVLSTTVEIKAFIGDWSIEFHELLEKLSAFDRNRRSHKTPSPQKGAKKDERYDYYISSLSRPLLKKIYGIEVDDGKLQKIGYLKKLPVWSAFVDQEAAKLKCDAQPYFVYFLSGLDDSTAYLYPPLEESLRVLKKYNKHIKTVFKPAFITKMDDFRDLIKKTGYTNYEINYAHPSIVSCHARFAMAYVYTTALFNAYVIGKPVVVYTQHADPSHHDILGDRTEGGRACDYNIFHDPKKLETVLDALVNTSVTVQRDHEFMKQNFPDTPMGFWTFWNHTIMAGKRRREAAAL